MSDFKRRSNYISREKLANSQSKKLKEQSKKDREAKIENFKRFVSELSSLSNKEDIITLDEKVLPNFFDKSKIEFEANKVHIIQGGNGLGKSTLLKCIGNATMSNVLHLIHSRVCYGSNNVKVGSIIDNTQFSPYKFSDILQTQYSNIKDNITLYCDFTVEFFKDKDENNIHYMLDRMECSNGEQKINVIKDIFVYLNWFRKFQKDNIEIFDKGIDLIVIMDEPESGLDNDIQKEFKNKILTFLKDNTKIDITFFIASHSLVWELKKSKYIQLHDINDFKIESEKKTKRKKMFKL